MTYTALLDNLGIKHTVVKPKYPLNQRLVSIRLLLPITVYEPSFKGDKIPQDQIILIQRVTDARNKMSPWEVKTIPDDGVFTVFKSLSILNRVRAFWMKRAYKKQLADETKWWAENVKRQLGGQVTKIEPITTIPK